MYLDVVHHRQLMGHVLETVSTEQFLQWERLVHFSIPCSHDTDVELCGSLPTVHYDTTNFD